MTAPTSCMPRLTDGLSSLAAGARARVVRAITRYLATPIDDLATLTIADRDALASVLRCGDVLLCAGSTRCAELVKRVTRSKWSHVAMYVGALDGAPDPRCIVDADIAGGVRATRLSDLDACRVCVMRPVGLDSHDCARLAESVLRHVGSEYDLAHAWLLACSLLGQRWWARLRSVRGMIGRSANRFICSSLIAQAFAVIGHSIPPCNGIVVDGLAQQYSLVPADFERAALFAMVCTVNVRDEWT